MPRENRQFLFESTPRTAVQPPSAAPLLASQMFCWLAFGDHKAFKRDTKRGRILIPADGPTIHLRYVADFRRLFYSGRFFFTFWPLRSRKIHRVRAGEIVPTNRVQLLCKQLPIGGFAKFGTKRRRGGSKGGSRLAGTPKFILILLTRLA